MAFMLRRTNSKLFSSLQRVAFLYGHGYFGLTRSPSVSTMHSSDAVEMAVSLSSLSNLISTTHSSTYITCSDRKSYKPMRLLEQSSYSLCPPVPFPIQTSFWHEHHKISFRQNHVRSLSNASLTLKMDSDVIRFCVDKSSDAVNRERTKGSDEIGTQMNGRLPKRAKKSKKAKVNELKFYRLMAKKKMTSPNPEVRIRYKLDKAKRKEAWLIDKLRKFDVPKPPAETYDPEILTEEEKFYLKRTGEKKKHYVPVGRRGVFGGVILNMHLHWKNHETVKVVCKPCKPGQVEQYAQELARLSKGIVIDIKANNVIIFYRGKNYVQPKVMSPPDTLSKNKALEKFTYEQSLEHTSQFIEKLENELEEYHKHVARFKKGKSIAEDTMGNI